MKNKLFKFQLSYYNTLSKKVDTKKDYTDLISHNIIQITSCFPSQSLLKMDHMLAL